jgi:hypothetical protein
VVWCAGRLHAQQVHALRVDLLGLPRGLGQKPVQALGMRMRGTTDGLGVDQRGEGRIAFSGQEQALQIATEGVTLIAFRKERVNVSSVRFEGAGAGAPGSRVRIPSSTSWSSTSPSSCQQSTIKMCLPRQTHRSVLYAF